MFNSDFGRFESLPKTINDEDLPRIEEYLHNLVRHIKKLDTLIGPFLIYFSQDKAKKLNFILDGLNELGRTIGEWEQGIADNYYSGEKVNERAEAFKNDTDITYFLTVIADDFRELIGVETATPEK